MIDDVIFSRGKNYLMGPELFSNLIYIVKLMRYWFSNFSINSTECKLGSKLIKIRFEIHETSFS